MSHDVVLRNATGQLSLKFDRRTLRVVLALWLVLLASVLGALCLGSELSSPLDVLEAIVFPERSRIIGFIVNELRMPRVLLAVLVGAALSVAGLILQGIVRNPLASPDIIGVTGGASVAAVLFLSLEGGGLGIQWLPLVAMAGAAIVSLGIFALAWQRGVTPVRLVLIGIGIAAAMGAVTTLLVVLSPDTTAMRAYVWLTGSIYAAQWRDVQGMLPWVAVFIPLALIYARRMDVMSLGDGLATGLGLNVGCSRFVLLLISVALAGSAVAFAGGLSFVGLIGPHIARKLVNRGFAGLVLVSSIIGALIVLFADVLARVAFHPHDLPAGIFVSGIGAPFFVWLLYRSRY